MAGVKEITRTGAKFVDGQEKEFDSIILATGYKSNVPSWLKVSTTPLFTYDFLVFLLFCHLYFHSCIAFNLIHMQKPTKPFFFSLQKEKNWLGLFGLLSPPFQKRKKRSWGEFPSLLSLLFSILFSFENKSFVGFHDM